MIIKKTKEIKIFNFINKIYHINSFLNSLCREKNKKVKIKGSTVAKLLFIGMFSREKSLNQIMEKTHFRKKYKNIFSKKEVIPKMHGFRDCIKELNMEELVKINKSIIAKAKENKVYRAGSIDGLVVVGIDGVESFESYKKDWKNSYKNVKKIQKYNNGQKETIEREYHKQINVVAKVVGKKPGLIIGYEKITRKGKQGKQEYEPEVGKKLVKKLKKNYGLGIDVIVGDAIYLNKEFIETLYEEKYVGIIRLKGNNKGLLEDAEGIFKKQEAKKWKRKRKVVNTNIHQEREIKSWSEILKYKEHKVKVVKFEETYKKGKERQKEVIYVMCTNIDYKEELINKIIHARWDIENNGFNELKNYWNMKHCYMANEKAIDVILQMIIMSYNLWEMYLYGHLHDFEGKKITKIGYIEKTIEMMYIAKKEEINFSSA